MDIKKEYFSENTMTMDLFASMCGEYLGTGESRAVYRWAYVDDIVVKFEYAPKYFSNQAEWDIWNQVKGTPLAKWFAPIIDISPVGNILWQRYIPDIPKAKLPKRVPACFTDLKPDNWGLLKGQPVCRDYGNHAAFDHGLTSKMKKAVWRI